jgi:hypothetical protein
MPLYSVFISSNRHDPLPPVDETTTVEAESAEEALAKLLGRMGVRGG